MSTEGRLEGKKNEDLKTEVKTCLQSILKEN